MKIGNVEKRPRHMRTAQRNDAKKRKFMSKIQSEVMRNAFFDFNKEG